MDKNVIKIRLIETLKIVLFIVIFLVVLEAVSDMFFSEKTATLYNNKMKDTYAFVNEKDNTLDIIAIGNSDVYSGISPLDLWRYHGYTSAVCGSAKQSVSDSITVLETVFEKQKPKLIIIETDMFYDNKPRKRRKLDSEGRKNAFFDKLEPEPFENTVESYFPIFRFHTYWRGGRSKKNKPYNTRGFKYKKRKYRLEEFDYMIRTDRVEPIKDVKKGQIRKMVSFCRKSGAKVLFVELPSVLSWNYERHNAVKLFAEELKVPFIDLNLHYEDAGIKMSTCFRDARGSHLNYDAARAATRYLGEYISVNYDITDHRDDGDYAEWEDDLNAFDNYREMSKRQRRDDYGIMTEE